MISMCPDMSTSENSEYVPDEAQSGRPHRPEGADPARYHRDHSDACAGVGDGADEMS